MSLVLLTDVFQAGEDQTWDEAWDPLWEAKGRDRKMLGRCRCWTLGSHPTYSLLFRWAFLLWEPGVSLY